MKRFLFLLLAGLLVLGADGKRKPKTLEIDGVRDYDRKENGERVTGLEISFSGADDSNNNYLRIAMRVMDKKTKVVYCVERVVSMDFNYKDYETAGHGHYEYQFASPKSQRLKITGYVVEFGKKVGKGFEPLIGQYEDVESYEELVSSEHHEWKYSEIKMGKNSTHYVHGTN